MLLLLSIVLVYVVMAAQFENYRDPFIVMFSIPFSFTGVFLALLVTGKPLSIMAFLSAILLIGIVVKNAIVLDRKSTRLNSSHVAISYAVFCLNKKNNVK